MSDAPKRAPRSLEQSCVLITGGTSGVGLEAAAQFAEAGVRRIAINGRNVERGEKAREFVLARAPSAEVIFIAGDCNDLSQATAVCRTAHEAFGAIDVLVNSTVGAFYPTLFHKIAPEDIGRILTQQMLAPLLTSRLALPFMREAGGGVIINIASDAAKVATPGESVIGAAMAGIVMFSRTLAMEGKRDGIRVNVLTPSIIEGTLTYGNVMKDEFSGKLFGKAVKMAGLGVAKPEDLASMIVFLASPQAAKLTGQAISVNGGISAA